MVGYTQEGGKQYTKTTQKKPMALKVYKNTFLNKKKPFQIGYITYNDAQFHPMSSDPENFVNIIYELNPWGMIFSRAVVTAFLYNFIFCVIGYLRTQTIPFWDLALAC